MRTPPPHLSPPLSPLSSPHSHQSTYYSPSQLFPIPLSYAIILPNIISLPSPHLPSLHPPHSSSPLLITPLSSPTLPHLSHPPFFFVPHSPTFLSLPHSAPPPLLTLPSHSFLPLPVRYHSHIFSLLHPFSPPHLSPYPPLPSPVSVPSLIPHVHYKLPSSSLLPRARLPQGR